jgi:hypothetical protein
MWEGNISVGINNNGIIIMCQRNEMKWRNEIMSIDEIYSVTVGETLY